ncbi:MAG: energy-coupling factor ABC transporter permease [candidate division Zixibacteria bacterium]|nr:energy-coupling factor ABC transporter permease [candidate division Zixibacteria bacterium]
MHIADGIIATEICIAADALAVGVVYAASRRVESDEIPRMGLIGAALFVVSLVHFPLAGTSLHLGLYGLAGLLLGRRAFPVILAALLLQALIFQHGGLLSVGLNAINMGLGATVGWLVWKAGRRFTALRAFGAGFLGVMVPAVLMAFEFELSGYGKGIFYITGLYLIVGVIEGVITAATVGFFKKYQVSILEEVK